MPPLSHREVQRQAEQSRSSFAEKLDTDAAARHCGVSTSYLNKLRCVGGGPVFLKLGRRVVYSVDDLDGWLASQRRVSTSDTGTEAA